MRAHVVPLFARVTAIQTQMFVEATASLCDAEARSQVVASFEPWLSSIADGRRVLDHAIASIDRCIAHRARLGDVLKMLR